MVLNQHSQGYGVQGKCYPPIVGDDKPFDASNVIGANGIKEQFWFGADYYSRTLPQAGAWLVWDKQRDPAMFGSGFELIWCKQKHQRLVLRHHWLGFGGGKEAMDRQHPTQKPSALLRDIMGRWGKSGDTVYDPFSGSGSTLVAAEATGRICYGVELEPRYVDVICQRWQNLTNQQATLDGDGRTFAQVAESRVGEAVPA